MGKKLAIGCGIPLVLIVVVIYISARTLLHSTPQAQPSEAVSRGDVEIKVVENGVIEPLRKVDVKSKVGGRVLRLYSDEGAIVRPGQMLASIDPQEINSEVAALRAQLAGAQARLASAQKNTVYQSDQTRTSVDQYVQAVESAKSHLNEVETEAKAQPELTQQSIDMAQATLDSAQASLKAQQESLNLMRESTHPQAVVSAQAAYDSARVQAANDQKSLQRQKQLLGKGFVSQQVVDAAETTSEISEAHVREVKERVDRIKQTNALEEANSRAQITNAESQVRQMQAALAQARSNTLPTTKRQELDSARSALKQAQAQLAAARAGKTQNLMRKDEATSAAAEVQQIQNQLKERLVSQGDTTLYASMGGMITKRYVEQGELITSPLSSFSSGSPIFQISDLATMLVKINVNEVDIAKVTPGTRVDVTIDAARGVTFAGHVYKVSPAAATSDSASGSSSSSSQSVIRFPVQIQINRADPRLKPGMSAHCAIIVSLKQNTLRLPSNCVQGTGSKGTVQIVTSTMKDGQPVETTTKREVVVGLRGDEWVEIVSGVKEGEKVRPNPYTGPPRKGIDMNGGGPM